MNSLASQRCCTIRALSLRGICPRRRPAASADPALETTSHAPSATTRRWSHRAVIARLGRHSFLASRSRPPLV